MTENNPIMTEEDQIKYAEESFDYYMRLLSGCPYSVMEWATKEKFRETVEAFNDGDLRMHFFVAESRISVRTPSGYYLFDILTRDFIESDCYGNVYKFDTDDPFMVYIIDRMKLELL